MPGMGYIYLPVGSDEMLEFANDWNTSRKRRGEAELPVIATTSRGAMKVIRRLCGHGNLRHVGTEDTLFVIAHGSSQGSRYIGAARDAHRELRRGVTVWEGGTMKKWSPQEFAQHLEKEGLPKGFRDLRLVACGSGLKSPKAERPYGEDLFNALRANGYWKIQVTGYLGAVRFTDMYGLTVEYNSHGVTLEPGDEFTRTWM